MYKSFSPAKELQIERGAKRKLFLIPCATLALFTLAFIFAPYITTKLKASAAGASTAEVSATITEAWAALVTSGGNNNPDPIPDGYGEGSLILNGNSAATPDADGTLYVQQATATVATNSPAGYQLYLSGNNAVDGKSTMAGPGSNKITSIATDAVSTFSTSNTWGYAVTGDNVVSGFDASYSVGAFTGSAISANKFKGIIGVNDGNITANANKANALIASDNHAHSTGVDTDVYYGALIDASTVAGTYSAEVTYTLVADYVTRPTDDPNYDIKEDEFSHTETVDGNTTYYYHDGSGGYYYYDSNGSKITALGVNKTQEAANDTVATIGNISDGNITWAAIAIVAGASATFLAIALLRDREDEDEEEL